MAVALESYVAQVRRVLWLTLGVNLSVVAVKLFIGLGASSLVILSDAAHSSVDSLNNMMGLLIMRLVRPYADYEHPYGHSKFEVVGAMGIAAFMLLTVYEIISTSISRLLSGESPVHITPATIGAFALTIAGNILVIWYETGQGKRLGSQFLLADARHTMTDLYVTLSVIVGLILVATGYPIMDAVASLAMALIVAFTAYRVVRDAVPVLVDQAVHHPGEIRRVVEEIPDVEQATDIRTRGAGPGCFIELTIDVAVESLREAHEVSNHVEQALHDRFGPDCTVTVHIEPVGE